MFGKLIELFGKDLGKRILFLVTFADGGLPQCLEPLKTSDLPFDGSDKSYFKFNNSALNSLDRGSLTETFWKMGNDSLEEFFKHI